MQMRAAISETQFVAPYILRGESPPVDIIDWLTGLLLDISCVCWGMLNRWLALDRTVHEFKKEKYNNGENAIIVRYNIYPSAVFNLKRGGVSI